MLARHTSLHNCPTSLSPLPSASSWPSIPSVSQSIQSLSRVQLFATLWTAACQASLSPVQLLSHGQLFSTPRTAGHQASLSITNSQSLLKLTSIKSVMPSNHLILCCPLLLCIQSFLASVSFQMGQFFASGGQSIGVSASALVLPKNIQD